MEKGQFERILILTIIFYLFGSVCAGSFYFSEWNSVGRIVLALVWVYVIMDTD